jgi:hypothetical protein
MKVDKQQEQGRIDTVKADYEPNTQKNIVVPAKKNEGPGNPLPLLWR